MTSQTKILITTFQKKIMKSKRTLIIHKIFTIRDFGGGRLHSSLLSVENFSKCSYVTPSLILLFDKFHKVLKLLLHLGQPLLQHPKILIEIQLLTNFSSYESPECF